MALQLVRIASRKYFQIDLINSFLAGEPHSPLIGSAANGNSANGRLSNGYGDMGDPTTGSYLGQSDTSLTACCSSQASTHSFSFSTNTHSKHSTPISYHTALLDNTSLRSQTLIEDCGKRHYKYSIL